MLSVGVDGFARTRAVTDFCNQTQKGGFIATILRFGPMCVVFDASALCFPSILYPLPDLQTGIVSGVPNVLTSNRAKSGVAEPKRNKPGTGIARPAVHRATTCIAIPAKLDHCASRQTRETGRRKLEKREAYLSAYTGPSRKQRQ